MNQIETVTERDLAAMLRCTPAALRRMRCEGRGPRWIRVGRLVRYPGEWVREWIEGNEGTVQHITRSSAQETEADGLRPSKGVKS